MVCYIKNFPPPLFLSQDSGGFFIWSQPLAKVGRPSSYTVETGDLICVRLAEGNSLRSICDKDGIPSVTTVMRWLASDASFREQYARAREAQADRLAEEILEIADDGRNDTYTDDDGNERTNQEVVARSRLRVDARKWLASKMAPKKYGDKIEHVGDPANPIQTVTRIELAAMSGNGKD